MASSIGTITISGLSNYTYILFQGYIVGQKHSFLETIKYSNATYTLGFPYISVDDGIVDGYRACKITISSNSITFIGVGASNQLYITRIYGTNNSDYLPNE